MHTAEIFHNEKMMEEDPKDPGDPKDPVERGIDCKLPFNLLGNIQEALDLSVFTFRVILPIRSL